MKTVIHHRMTDKDQQELVRVTKRRFEYLSSNECMNCDEVVTTREVRIS